MRRQEKRLLRSCSACEAAGAREAERNWSRFGHVLKTELMGSLAIELKCERGAVANSKVGWPAETGKSVGETALGNDNSFHLAC